jgi:tryptophanyl-tRNA synthetase
MTTIVTGMKPTGTPHLGNHFGMIEPTLRLATGHDAFVFVADLHALNTNPDPVALRRHVHEVAATFLALGLDPQRSVLYRQSDVPEVSELAQLLAAVTPKGLLNRAHAYKAAVAANEDRGLDRDAGVNVGLFSYPLLMTADVLALGADRVPVGGDQQQHLEIARDIALAFNATYGPTFALPEAAVDDRVELVPGTDGRKMSKSNGNTIPVLGEPQEVLRAVMRIVTDTRPVEEPKDPEQDVIFRLYRLVADPDATADLARRYREGGLRYVDAKRALATALIDGLAGARAAYRDLLDDPETLEATLAAGAERASRLATHHLDGAREAVGLGRPLRTPRRAA